MRGDKIQEMLTKPPGPQAVAVLVNALYFKGGWTDVFEEQAATKQADFLSSGRTGSAGHDDEAGRNVLVCSS
ncbi:serpin family protein [Paenibacillus rhizoplanae]